QTLLDINFGRPYLWVPFEKKCGELHCKIFDACCRGIPCQRVHRIFHGVGRKNLAVVTVSKTGREVAVEKHLSGPVVKFVPLSLALHTNHTNARLAVAIFTEPTHQIRFLDTWCSRAGSPAVEYENAIRPCRRGSQFPRMDKGFALPVPQNSLPCRR